MRWLFRTMLLLLIGISQAIGAESTDVVLGKIVQAYQLSPLEERKVELGPKERLGQALFFDSIVSGPRSIACATCHIRSKGAGDGLPMAVGLGAHGLASDRLNAKQALVIPRNALPLFNRDALDFIAMFWDGRVQLSNGAVETPLGSRLPAGFDNLLASAAVFPLAEPDEMLGRSKRFGDKRTYHAELVGPDVDGDHTQNRTLAVFKTLISRLLEPGQSAPSMVAKQYRALFKDAYPSIPLEQIQIQHIGNALSVYIGAAFATKRTPWDRYIAGDKKAITDDQKRGAIVFYGKGRCAVCHSGTHFTDFKFHGLAIPQLRVGKHTRNIDYGRAAATSRPEDRYAFRTPPLRNVVETGPYGHNGSISSLPEMIEHHFNPVPSLYRAQQSDPDLGAHSGRLLGFRSPILAEVGVISKQDTELLIKFLSALSAPTVMSDSVAIPANTPSGEKTFLKN